MGLRAPSVSVAWTSVTDTGVGLSGPWLFYQFINPLMNHAFKESKELLRYNLILQHYPQHLKTISKASQSPTPRRVKQGTFLFPESSKDFVQRT